MTSSSTPNPWSTTGPIDDDDEGGYWNDSDERAAPNSTTPPIGPSRGSIADVDDELFAGLVGVALGTAGLVAHNALTPGADNTVWMLEQNDLDAMARPLSRIIARRVPIGPAGNADVVDAVEFGVAAADYAIRNVHKTAQRRAGETFDEGTAGDGNAA